ncbi:hypothetical protein GCM10022422_30810 [Flavobacterium ginsengisoli]|uniref:Tail specific protease domain-containing protein n=1 Tax=Flavobacterium ginsengisoli TaxID=871694 RepID=A0ABP7FV38_9FLAO|nr:S41 family peptidase [Flavobacterium ginsengisoli]
MKKYILFILMFIGTMAYSHKNISHRAFLEKNLTEIEKLAATAKVWGFLKYYHPKVADGSQNWDEQLFKILRQTENTQTVQQFSNAISDWIMSLGEVKKYENIKTDIDNVYFDKNIDFSWFDDRTIFTKELSQMLKFVQKYKFQGENYYVTFQKKDPNAVPLQFINEVKYSKFDWTDKNMRLLAFFRYWNYVEYFFPYKYQTDQDWNLVLTEMMPKFSDPKTELDFHLAMRELSVKLNDSHSSLGTSKMYDKFGEKFVPADFKIIDSKAVVVGLKNDSLARISDIKIGDVITEVEGKSIQTIIKENTKYVEGSNKASVLRNFYWAIFNGNSDSVQVKYTREGRSSQKYIKRYEYAYLIAIPKPKEKWRFLNNKVSYVNLGEITEDDVPEMMNKIMVSDAIIFDLRNNARGADYLIAEYLNPEPREFVKFADADLKTPGNFIWRKEEEKCGKVNPNYYKGKVIVLVNEVTQSHGEYTAMSLKVAPNTTVIGSQTSGADGGVVRFEIIRGFRTQFSSYGVFYPNKKETQRIGIVPDIKVEQTIKGIQSGKDEILERALKFAEKGK